MPTVRKVQINQGSYYPDPTVAANIQGFGRQLCQDNFKYSVKISLGQSLSEPYIS